MADGENNSNSENSWESWLGGWVQTAKEKSNSALEFVKKDLAEFTCTMQKETEKAVELTKDSLNREKTTQATNKVKAGLSSLLDNISKVLVIPPDDDYIQVRVAADGSGLYDRGKARLHALQLDASTYMDTPHGPPEQYSMWLESFNMDQHKGEISELLVSKVEVRALYTKLVPCDVSHAEFWQRYFYRIHQLQCDEARKQALMKRAEQTKGDSFSWDDDEEDWSGGEDNQSDWEKMPRQTETYAPSKSKSVDPVQTPPTAETNSQSDTGNSSIHTVLSNPMDINITDIKTDLTTENNKEKSQQQAIASSPETVVREQDGVVSSPETVVREQDGVVSSPETVVREQEGVVSSPKTVVREQEGVVSSPETVVREQGVVSSPETVVREQEGVVSSPETVVREQGVVSSPETVVREQDGVDLKSTTAASGFDVPEEYNSLARLQQPSAELWSLHIPDDGVQCDLLDQDVVPETTKPQGVGASGATEVVVKSDDIQPPVEAESHHVVETILERTHDDCGDNLSVSSPHGLTEHTTSLPVVPKTPLQQVQSTTLQENIGGDVTSAFTKITDLPLIPQPLGLPTGAAPTAEIVFSAPKQVPENMNETPKPEEVSQQPSESIQDISTIESAQSHNSITITQIIHCVESPGVDAEPDTVAKDVENSGDVKEIGMTVKGDMVVVGERVSPTYSDVSDTKEIGQEDDWEQDFDIEVTEEDLKAADDIAKRLSENLNVDDDWENWE